VNNPYAQQQPQQPQQHQQPPAQQYAQNLPSPQPAYQPRAGYQQNDATNGLIQQFSNQDLSAPPRSGIFGRNPAPAPRPRTAGSPAGAQHPTHLAPPMPVRSQKPASDEEEPVRCPEKYSENVHKRGKAAKELVNVFFRDNIERARDRNLRYVLWCRSSC
jgi:protein-serine/threonine kinase